MSKNRIVGAAVAGALLTPAGVALAAESDPSVRPVVPRAISAQVTATADQAAHKRLVRRHMTLVRRYQRLADVELDRGEISSILLRRDSETVRERTKELRDRIRDEQRRRRAERTRGGGAGGGGGAPSAALQAIAQCESGGDPGAVSANGQYRGKYQFSRETWAAVGGSGDPAAASEAEQDRRAAILMRQAGPGQWPVCGG